MMEAVRTSETSVYFIDTIRCNISEDYHLHTRRRENLQSHKFIFCFSLPPLYLWRVLVAEISFKM
jgi:hypothetical protein